MPLLLRRVLPVVALLLAGSRLLATDVLIPFGKGSVVVPVGSTIKTTCTNAVTHISICKDGNCKEARTYACAPFGCAGATRCASSCASDSDCASGAQCNSATGQWALTVGNTCRDAFTIKSADGTMSSCSPYRCVAGVCWGTCRPSNKKGDSADCATGKCVISPTTGGYYCK